MANELTLHSPANSGDTLYVQVENTVGQLWNGSAYEAPVSGSWATYKIAMTEQATSTGIFRATMPAAAAAAADSFIVRKQAGGGPVVGDIVLGSGLYLDKRMPAAGTITNLNTLYDGVEGFAPAYAGPRGPGVYLNDAAANTSTVNGEDGTWANPVSTIAAAKTIADSLSIDRIYLLNDSSVILAATMEDYEFVGIGEMSANTVNFGTQDVDQAVFYNLVLTGTQGGTGRCQAVGCCLSSIVGMEITALWCLIANAGSLTLRDDCAFDACFSAVAGGDTPTLNINSVANVNVYFRHYSGGLKVTNAVATTVMSYESDGQLVIDATCTSLTIVPRGNLSITDNGTTTNINLDAAINLTNINAEVDTALVDINLDHFMKTATGGADMTTEVADNTVLSRVLSNGDTSAFDPSTDGLQPHRDEVVSEHAALPTAAEIDSTLAGSHGAGGWTTATTVDVSDKTGFELSSSGLEAIDTWEVDITGNITGDLSGSVGTVTNPVTVDTISADTITAASIATGAFSANAFATDSITADALAADAVAEIQSGLAKVGDAMALTAGERNSTADVILNRAASNIEDSADKHSLGALIMFVTNFAISGAVLTAKKPSDDSTFNTYTLATTPDADPVTGVG